MKDANREYENALAAFAEPGCRWEQKGQLVYWGKASGRTEEDVIADARSVGVTNRDATSARMAGHFADGRGVGEIDLPSCRASGPSEVSAACP